MRGQIEGTLASIKLQSFHAWAFAAESSKQAGLSPAGGAIRLEKRRKRFSDNPRSTDETAYALVAKADASHQRD